MGLENNILVSICCTTYNHESYISQCLDGFCIQKTNFDFEVLIHDDASIDQTSKIVKEYEIKYPHLFRCVYQSENQFTKQNTLVKILFPMSRGKYISLCEGDDYWTDPYKLQKQVDFLENNSDFGMVFTNYKILNKNGCFSKSPFENIIVPQRLEFKDIIMGHFNGLLPITLTTCFRKQLLSDTFLDFMADSENKIGDYSIFLWSSYKSDVKFLNEITGVYRENPDSLTNTIWRNYKEARVFKNNILYILNSFFSRNQIIDEALLEAKRNVEFNIYKENFIIYSCRNEKILALGNYEKLTSYRKIIPFYLKLIYYFIRFFPFGAALFHKAYLIKKKIGKIIK